MRKTDFRLNMSPDLSTDNMSFETEELTRPFTQTENI